MNADKTKYMVVSRDQRAGRNHSVKIDSNSFEGVEEFRYLGTTLTNQNCIQVEVRSRLKLGNACYHSVQKLLSSRLLSKNLKINRLMPNDPYMGRTAPLTSKLCILYIYSTYTGTEYFKRALYSPLFLFKMQFVS